MKHLERVHLHPFIIGMFPVLSLFAHNQSELEPNALWRSLSVVMIITVVVFVILRLCLKDWTVAGFVTTFVSFIFFLYGPSKNVIYNVNLACINLGRHRYFLPIWVVLIIIGVWLIVRKVPRNGSIIQLFNIIAISSLILPLISIATYIIGHPEEYGLRRTTINTTKQVTTAQLDQLPDIYYIILDMYGRSDAIENEFGYDNLEFIEALRDQGFYVASCSTCNYVHSQLSLGSSMNMDYLPTLLGEEFVAENTDYSGAGNLIKNNAVRRYLKNFGYDYVTFQSENPSINTPDSEVIINFLPETKYIITPFELFLIEKTPLLTVSNSIYKQLEIEELRVYGYNYDRLLFILDEMTKIPESITSPKFVFIHLLVPHPPYVFGPNGEYVGNDERFSNNPDHTPINDEAYHLAYTNQVRFLDRVMPDILEKIISGSKTPPVIVIQGDHGFWGGGPERFPILNAYFLPGKDPDKLLYPNITPVNTFRVILNSYFKGQFELMPDQSFLSRENLYDVYIHEFTDKDCRPK
jgi:hypothetical protein